MLQHIQGALYVTTRGSAFTDYSEKTFPPWELIAIITDGLGNQEPWWAAYHMGDNWLEDQGD